ncbi:MAG: 16S rRNA (uracil(1498)-N(3))-methyltransferase [Kiloniellales bacterium]|nr:16S rRNA (uracil(1498)-N(3))-methyltransferase [Kiloniellales bacterium]
MTAKIETRLYVEDDLHESATIGLDHGRAHFLRSVLRLGQGARVALFNGRDGEWQARIDGLGKGWASLQVEHQRRPQTDSPDVWLAFAPIKRARLDFLIEKAVELGVARLRPVMTEHTAVSRVNRDRLAANAREAAEQCERLDLPAVDEPIRLFDLFDGWRSDRRLLLCAEAGPSRPIAEVLAEAAERRGGNPVSDWALLTGPEGGFSHGELDALRKLPFVTAVGLGPRVLRADTAALAALACWQAWLGDGGHTPPRA